MSARYSTGTPGRLQRALADARALRPSGAMVAGAVALALAAAAGWWLGGASRDQAAAPVRDSVVAVGPLRLGLEPTWVSAATVAGLSVDGAEIFAPASGLAARALLVTGPAADASLIPSALRSELPTALPEPRRVKLAGLPAWIYGPFRESGRVLEVTVAPTTAGVLALACSTPEANWTAWLDCGNGVRAITGERAKSLAPAPDLAFRRVAGPTLEKLDAERVAGRARLAGAQRVAAATALARAQREAAATLAPFATPGAPAAVVIALRDGARGYDALAAAARSGGRARFVSARARVVRSDAALAAAVAHLRG